MICFKIKSNSIYVIHSKEKEKNKTKNRCTRLTLDTTHHSTTFHKFNTIAANFKRIDGRLRSQCILLIFKIFSSRISWFRAMKKIFLPIGKNKLTNMHINCFPLPLSKFENKICIIKL